MQEIKVQLPQPLHLETPNLNNPSIVGGFTHNMNLNNSTINQPAINNGHANNMQLHNSTINNGTINGGSIISSQLVNVSLNTNSILYQGRDLNLIIRDMADIMNKQAKVIDALKLTLIQKNILKNDDEFNDILKSIELFDKMGEMNNAK